MCETTYPVTVYYAFKQQDAGFMIPHPQTPSPTRREGALTRESAAVSPSPFMGAGGRGVGASTGWETMLYQSAQV